MKLYVGSINRVKVSAVVEALDDFDLNIIPFEATSALSALGAMKEAVTDSKKKDSKKAE